MNSLPPKFEFAAACLLVAFVATPVSAQQTTGAAGSPSATSTIDGRADTPASRRIRRHDQPRCSELHALLAASGGAAKGRAKHSADHHRRRGLRRAEHVRRRHSDADARSHRQYGPALHAVSHHFAVLADARGTYHRPQSSLGRLRRDQRGLDRLSRLQQRHHQGQGDDRTGSRRRTAMRRRGTARTTTRRHS